MNEKTKTFFWKLKQFLKYITIEIWITNFTFPNVKTISWIFIFISAFSRNFNLIWISLGIGLIVYLINEFKSGQFIYLMRNKKYKEFYYIKKKIKKERKNKLIKQETDKKFDFLDNFEKPKDLNTSVN